VSILVVKDKERKDAGHVRLDSLERITNFSEKKEGTHNGYINTGIYIINKDVLLRENFKKLQKISLEEKLIPEWVQKYKVMGCITEGPLIDIGTPERLVEAKLKLSAFKNDN
jgi:NDP-sugar pyrophosphorylase family protein